jgi:hypothetical protein
MASDTYVEMLYDIGNGTENISGTVGAHSNCGPIYIAHRGLDFEGTRTFKPDSPLYRPTNAAVAGNVVVQIFKPTSAPAVPHTPTSVAVTFVNTTDEEGSVQVYAAVGVGPTGGPPEKRIPQQPMKLASGVGVTIFVIFKRD